MANYKWPNVYANIKDLSGVVATNSVTSCGYVGEAEFGPINKPTFLSTLKDYTSKFGALNSAKYGYAGYSLAVASESIDSHYFVRTVRKGDPEAHTEDDAMYASIKFPKKDSSVAASGFGWYVEEIEAVEKTEKSSSLFNYRQYYIKDFELVNQGANYNVNDVLKADTDETDPETGLKKTAKFQVTGLKSEYKVTALSVVNGGEGYINGEQLTIQLDGTNATAYAVVPEPVQSQLSWTVTGTLQEEDVNVNKQTFESQISTTGEYLFTFVNDAWELDSVPVNIDAYGITVLVTPEPNDTITISYVQGSSTTALTGVELATPGASSIVITEPVPVNGAEGTGATLQLTMANTGKIETLELIENGHYDEKETRTVSLTGGTGAGATVSLTLSNLDLDDALIFVADNPNNLKLGIRLTDSTINENRAYAFSTADYVTTGTPNTYVVTIHDVSAEVLKDLSIGDMITVTRTSNSLQEGNFTVSAINGTNICYTYVSKNTPVTLTYGKVAKYPEPNERTFQVDVYMTKGKLTQNVETYQYCTLYQNKDAYGNSTFVEDVINGSSDYVKVYVNPNLLDALSEDEVLEPKLVTVTDDATALVGGKSGAKPTSNDLNAGWELFKDRTQTNVSLLLNSGYTNAGETSYQNAMLDVAEYRRDCFCLFDIPMTEVEPEAAIDWRKNILGTTSYRAALSSPWVRTYDSVQGRANFVMCPSAFLAKLIGAAGDPWHAPAGPNRGILSSSTVSPTGLTEAYDSVIGGTLYADNQINCIVRDVAAGYVNWGQRTLQAKPSALDRINVARTVIYIETILRDAARWHLFENNTAYERMQITLQFSAFLDTVLSADGIAAYKVICDTSNNTPIVIANNQLVIDVILTPVYAAESIILNTTITGADASVDISSSAA